MNFKRITFTLQGSQAKYSSYNWFVSSAVVSQKGKRNKGIHDFIMEISEEQL